MRKCSTSLIDTNSLDADLLPLGKTAIRGSIALSMCKASETTGCGRSPPTPFWYLNEGGTRWRTKLSICTVEVKMMAGGDTISKKTVNLAWGKEGAGWGMDPLRMHRRLGWESTWSSPHGKTNLNIREGREQVSYPSQEHTGQCICGTFWPWKPCR